MKALLGYEIKKILMRKSTVVTFVLLFGMQVFLAFAGSIGATYVDDTFVETHWERNQVEREWGLENTGRKFDEALFAELKEAYSEIDWSTKEYLLSGR